MHELFLKMINKPVKTRNYGLYITILDSICQSVSNIPKTEHDLMRAALLETALINLVFTSNQTVTEGELRRQFLIIFDTVLDNLPAMYELHALSANKD
jgi:hypothetical protein